MQDAELGRVFAEIRPVVGKTDQKRSVAFLPRLPTGNFPSCFCARGNSGFVASAFAGTLAVGVGRAADWRLPAPRKRRALTRARVVGNGGSGRRERVGVVKICPVGRWVGTLNKEMTHKVGDPPPA